MQVIAHRGANEALENRWSAFELAIAAGSVRIELDVQTTADGELAIIHDEDLHRTAGTNQCISQLTRSQISKLKLSNGEPIPFLDDVIKKLLPHVELNIELKGNDVYQAEQTAQLVKKLGDPSRIIISSFHLVPLEYLAEEHPELTRACLWGRWWGWPYFAHFAPPVFMQRARSSIIHPCTSFVTAGMMDQAKSRGWTVYAYAEFNGEEADRRRLVDAENIRSRRSLH